MRFCKQITVLAACFHAATWTLPQPLFWLPPWFIQTPRLAHNWLLTQKLQIRGGVNNVSFGSDHHKTALLNIYGAENIRLLAEGVPADQLGNNSFLNTLYTGSPTSSTFGTINWSGQMSIFELVYDVTQNFKWGLFAQVVLPLRYYSIKSIDYTDNSTPATAGDINYTSWQQLFNNLGSVLKSYKIDLYQAKNSQPGDVQVILGWAENNESFDYIDFLDYSLVFGIFTPTSSRTTPTTASDYAHPFQVSTGFNHTTATALSAQTAIGFYDWLTLGAFATGYFFTKDRFVTGIKTATNQNGWLKLAREEVAVDRGNLYHLGGYISADHFIHAFSATLGFSYAHQASTRYTVLTNPSLYDNSVVNSDVQLQEWSMLTMHWQFEGDFAGHEHPGFPQLSLIIDVPIAGKRSMRNKVFGCYLQSNISW